MQLSSIISVIEVLESSFKGTLSVQLHDLHHLQECLSKTKQVLLPKLLLYLSSIDTCDCPVCLIYKLCGYMSIWIVIDP